MKNLQQPINSPFNFHSTAKQIMKKIDLTGKYAIVTGGYSGIGLVTSLALAHAGAQVTVPARHPDTARELFANEPNITVATLDLMDPHSIDQFADNYLASGHPLHILINSAGIMFPPLRRDSRRYESQFSTNHLGHFQLTLRLYPALQKAHGARVIAVSSRAQRMGSIQWDDINWEHTPYDPHLAYAQSKVANGLFAVGLDQYGQTDNIRAFAVHPGLIPTSGLGRASGQYHPFMSRLINQLGLLHARNTIEAAKVDFRTADYDYYKTLQQGAATQLWAATSPQLNDMGGLFLEDSNVATAVSANSASRFGVRPWTIDPHDAKRLWTISEQLTNTKLPQN
ncbi:SDR family NAD(P)-dependent oxidoreductase [Secundilactobacillus silagei]|uniref:SDR family NAD(P)-dependent oxidoreductase n=1 Tax=Secundilactobacillus silagei TaxID=1293415 RepID=UPI0038B46EFE